MVILKTIVGNLSANVNEITFTDTIINSNSIIEVYYNSNDVYTVETWQRENTIGIVTSDHDFPVSVKVLINNVVAFEPYDDTEVLSQLSDLDNRVYHAEDAISGLATRVGDAEDDIEVLENSKQDKLTAGNGISINNNVISSTISNSYSETEKVIGTWIDGKPVYEKTLIHSGVYTGNISPQPIAHGISNLKRCISITGFIYDAHDTNPSWMPIPRVYETNYFGISGIDNTYYNIYIPTAFGTRLRDSHIIIRYTKTTD